MCAQPSAAAAQSAEQVKRKRPPVSAETREKMAAARRGRTHSPETKQKMSEAAKDRKLSLSHRFSIANGHLGLTHSPETRAKIARTERATKRRLRQQRLLELQARAGGSEDGAGPAALALVPEASPAELAAAALLTKELAREKAVIEMMDTRLWLSRWMDAFKKEHDYQPTLPETSSSHPEVYAKFVRYVALREMVRQAEKDGPDSYPVLWE